MSLIYNKPNVRLYCGNALEVLKTFPDETVNMVMTSPPYWALRCYSHPDQLGQEPHFKDYIQKLCDIFDEVKRVLKRDGNCFVNIYTTFASSGNRRFDLPQTLKNKNKITDGRGRISGYPAKCDCMIPERFAIEMVNRGWIKRRTIIWHKENVMPKSLTDDFTDDFEYIYRFVKQKRYYFKQQFEPLQESSLSRSKYATNSEKTAQRIYGGMTLEGAKRAWERMVERGMRNKRCVWTINLRHGEGNHFATFPEELCEIPIRAGCPPGGIVLDPFAGTCSSGIMALKLNCKFWGIDINESYLREIAIPRFEREVPLLL